ncbi:MBL fold metallo-hydrolase [Segetibacter koreensis]|uniref:MBL fold metallo-hydrolase n=1 Tax=Segetibacter koreensis TaxID=398037 RepID=UPI000363B36F|nr:MBL fold metallo-hydrolase [Segetibacter koreensis]
MKIIPLSEGSFTIDKSKVFVPFAHNLDELQDRPIGSLLVEIQPFVVITSKDIILLDTGLGFSIDGKLQIYNNLEKNGINNLQVTKVLLSHLHKDHAGGISIKDKLGHYTLAFPNATYYLPSDELDYAFETGFPSYISDEFSILLNNNKAVLLDHSGTIDSYIHYELVGGHSPFHYAFWIKENEEIVFFGGDVAPQLQQMKSKFVAKYDFDGKKSMELRQKWWQQGRQENWTFLFYHDIKTPFFKAS